MLLFMFGFSKTRSMFSTSLLLLLVTLPQCWCDFSCPAADCSSDPCGEDDNDHCEVWSITADDTCESCEDGYWARSTSHECILCATSLGCTDCRNEAGCNECPSDGTWTTTTECSDGIVTGINYCAGSSLFDGATTDTEEEDEDEDEESEDDASSSSSSGGSSSGDVDCDEVNCITTESAVAYFTTFGIEGTVKVIKGNINVTLDLTEFDSFDEIGANCFAGGLYYGIYDAWEHETTTGKLGSDDCGIDNVGRRWDPWLACSTISGNYYCDSYGSKGDNCVPASSWLSSSDDSEYVCSEVNFQTNPFSCEVGDWSGKYGVLYYDSSTNMITGGGSSPYEVDGFDLTGKSIVFRCHDKSRAFCGTFTDYTVEEYEQEISRPAQNKTYSKIARFNGTSYVRLSYTNEYDIYITAKDVTVPGSCGGEIYYRIFTEYEDASYFYDPTITCDENSLNTEKGYCDDTELCGDGDWVYSCNYDSTNFDNYGRFQCAPTDLADKYGSIDISLNAGSWEFERAGYDSLMTPLAELTGKTLVLQCADYNIIGSAKFVDYKDDFDADRYNVIAPDDGEEEDDDGGSNKNKNKKKSSSGDSNIFGIGNTGAIVMFVLFVLAIVPCIKHYRDKKNGKANAAGSAGPAAVVVDGPRSGAPTNPKTGTEGYRPSGYGSGRNSANHSRNASHVSQTSRSQVSHVSGAQHNRQASHMSHASHASHHSHARSVSGASHVSRSRNNVNNNNNNNVVNGGSVYAASNYGASTYGGGSEYGGGARQAYSEYDANYGNYDANSNYYDANGQYSGQYNGQYDDYNDYNNQNYDENYGNYDENYDNASNYNQQYNDYQGYDNNGQYIG